MKWNGMDWTVIGVDPAPSKDSVICYEDDGKVRFKNVEAHGLKGWIHKFRKRHGKLLIVWDAPLVFDPKYGFYDRPIDKAARAALESHQCRKSGMKCLSKIKHSAQGFAACPHWAISSAVMGLPASIGDNLEAELVTKTGIEGKTGVQVLEVHPTVALAAWWAALPSKKRSKKGFPKYKGKGGTAKNRNTLISELPAIRDCGATNDDQLDAFVAYKLGKMFIAGEAELVGSSTEGYYVLPKGRPKDLPLVDAIKKKLN